MAKAEPPASDKLYYGDNLDVLRKHIADESVDLVYLDPPFNSNRNYNVLFGKHVTAGASDAAQIQAFGDTWVWTPTTDEQYASLMAGEVPPKVADALGAMRMLIGENDAMAYLVNMAPRMVELHRVLKPTGALYLHCDPTMSHYLKILLDAIFGPANFRNEVVWKRTATKGDARRKYGSVHDLLLFYSKSADMEFHSQETAHGDEYLSRFTLDDQDGRGPYEGAPLDSPNPRPNLTYEYKGFPPPTNGWRVNLKLMEELDADNRLIFPKKHTGRIRRKNYMAELKGRPIGDVWTDISPLNSQAGERLGYPTQKPVELLERIITASSHEGDVILDPFCGCGTTIDAAIKLKRRWVGIDVTYIAVDLIEKRLLHTYGDSVTSTYDVLGIPRDMGGAHALFEHSPFDFERWAVSRINAQPNEKQVGDKGIDGVGRFPTDAKGGFGRILVSVKGGKTIGPQFVRDLLGTVQTQKAQMGVLITMTEPTRGIFDAVNHAGTYELPVNSQTFPKVQIITVAQLLKGERPAMPQTLLPYIQATKRAAPKQSEGLF
jgi:site-specific DNA-methyltransferase (adenine-specific)